MVTFSGSVTLPTGAKIPVSGTANVASANKTSFGSDRNPIDNTVFLKNYYTRYYGGPGKGVPSIANAPKGCKPHISIKDMPTPTLLNPFLDGLTFPVFFEWHHEPEGDMSTTDYLAGQLMLQSTVNSHHNGRLVSVTQTFTRYAQVHGKNMTDGKPATVSNLWNNSAVLGMDCEIDKLFPGYPTYPDPATFFAPAVNAAKSLGVPFVIPELGWLIMSGDTDAKLAQWYTDCAKYLATQNCVGVAFYDTLGSTGDYRLTGRPLTACQNVCNNQ